MSKKDFAKGIMTRCGLILLFGLIAPVSTFAQDTFDVRATRFGQSLNVTIENKRLLASDCGLFVDSFEWDHAHTLFLNVQSNPCFIDRSGRPRGTWTWVLPVQLRGDSRVRIKLNSVQQFDVELKSQPGRLTTSEIKE